MEEITKELNSATEYLRAMKKSGHHKGDCDNVMMHLANIEDLVNKLFIGSVSVSLGKTETQFENELFSAYLTGQTDVRNREQGLEGRSFTSWYKDNFKPNER